MYIKKFFSQLKQFAAHEGGNYAMIFAVAMPALFGAVSIAVETTTMEKQRGDLQNALDVAALATGKHLSLTTDETALKAYAKAYFEANLDPEMKQELITFDFDFVEAVNSGTRIRLTADYDYPVLMPYLNKSEVAMSIVSEVTAGNRTIEVAIVIDNSGSMDTKTGGTNDTRMEKAKEAATTLSNQLFALASISNKPNPVRISIVPFGHSVNIGSANRGEPWMDMNGWSSIHHENIAWDAADKRGDTWPNFVDLGTGIKGSVNGSLTLPPSGGVVSVEWLTRWSLFDSLNTGWDGCVEMRPWPYHTTDDAPNDLQPDTLFVPMFAPDEPDENISDSEDDDYNNNYLYDYKRAYADPNPNSNARLTYKSGGQHYLKTSIPNVGSNKGNYTRQNWRQDWSMKYYNGAKNSSYNDYRSRDYGNYGPNMGCTTQALTPLSESATAIADAIDAMEPGGFTNVQAGIVWGWRTLSAGEPFTAGRGYDEQENDKYIIVLTDGNNTYPSQNTYNYSQYTSWGYEKSDRIFEGINSNPDTVGAMNIHTATTCENIKAIYDADNEPAYKIFTIAYDVSNGSSVKSLLYGCASAKKDGTKYYYDVAGDALAGAMRAIGNEISDLRISQ